MYKLIINLKTYSQATGIEAIKIAKICKELENEAKKRKVEIILCPQFTDLKDVSKEINTFVQHIDPIESGANTGYILPQSIKYAGAKGTLINHSEHIINMKNIEKTINIAKTIGLETCVCAENSQIAKKIAVFEPDYIAIEPKELIGGNISISTAKPQLIQKGVKAIGKIPLLVGAGIKNQNDVKIAIQLGAKGILVASGVIKSTNIKREIMDLISGFD